MIKRRNIKMNKQKKKYRIFCPQSEVHKLPGDITVEETYPAFVIASALEGTIAGVKKRFPVEAVKTPKPPPEVPEVASLPEALSVERKRGPYSIVVRFRAPVRRRWIEELETTGCGLQTTIGSSTVVVNCPNKKSLEKLKKQPTIRQISTYVPPIRVSPAFLEDLDLWTGDEAIEDIPGHVSSPAEYPVSTGGEPFFGVLTANFFTEDEKRRAKRRLRRKGVGKITESGERQLIINLTAQREPVRAIREIATQPGLHSLEEREKLKLHNNIARRIIGDRVVGPDNQGLGLTGKGEIVAVADTGLDTGDPEMIHPDFMGRVKDIRSFPIASWRSVYLKNPEGDDGPADIYSGHGTHVAGSVIGNGARAEALGLEPVRGTAPEAQLVFQAIEQTMHWKKKVIRKYRKKGIKLPKRGLYGIPPDLRELFQPAYDQGARIHSNSWGGSPPGEYKAQCWAVDQFIWDHKDFLILVAAGNEGEDIKSMGKGIDPSNLNSPATAKNCLTVGACENNRAGEFSDTYGAWWPRSFPIAPFKSDNMADSIDHLVAFSGRGPCTTGRRKPDVVAPGTFILSTRSSQIPDNNYAWKAFPAAKKDYMFMGGTSMATPMVAGCTALVRQYLRHTAGIETPSAALMKAAVIHSAQYISYRYANPSSSRWADNEQGWGRVDLQQVLNPLPPLKVLFFDDNNGLETGEERVYEIEVEDSCKNLRITLVYTDYPAEDLINNLNLFAYNPDNRFFAGNDFENTGKPDGDNNVEGIIIEEPDKGTWKIRVVASDVPKGPQDFALVVSGGGIKLNQI